MPNCNVWFQQDDTPSHFQVNVGLYLDNNFPGRRIGRRDRGTTID